MGDKVYATLGFFECVNAATVAEVLVSAACDWARARNVSALRGPYNLTPNDEPGLLVEGHDRPPPILCAHTLPYYLDFSSVWAFASGGQTCFAMVSRSRLTMSALIHCNGLRYPWDYARLWRHARRVRSVSFKILALDPDYWSRGLDALMYVELAKATFRKGYTWMDMSVTGEDNPQTNKLAMLVGARVYKRYRIFELAI
jgi:hypothetical protein